MELSTALEYEWITTFSTKVRTSVAYMEVDAQRENS